MPKINKENGSIRLSAKEKVGFYFAVFCLALSPIAAERLIANKTTINTPVNSNSKNPIEAYYINNLPKVSLQETKRLAK